MTARGRKSPSRRPSAIFVDTGYIIALLDKTDPFHAAAMDWTRRLAHPHRVTTTAVLGECGDGFAKRRAWQLFDPFLSQLEKSPFVEIVPVDRTLFDRAVKLRRKNVSRWWGITDCISFVVMHDRGITEALSADADYVAAGFDPLLLQPLAPTDRG